MEIADFERCKDKERVIAQIESCDWDAAKFLAKLLKENALCGTLGGWAKLFALFDDCKLVSFVTLSRQDCVIDESLTPWLGFLFTREEYRCNGCAKRIVEHACSAARQMGYHKVYLATDHVGLYEKLGFTYLESRIDVYGETSRIYCKTL